MLDLKFIRENPDAVRKAVDLKRAAFDLEAFLEIDKSVQELKKETEVLLAERNANAKASGRAAPEERASMIEKGKQIGVQLAELEPTLRQLESQLKAALYLVPNIPWDGSPVGEDDSFNLETSKVGTPRVFDFEPLDHVALIEKNGWGESERISRISGSRAYALRGDLMLYEQALLRFALDQLVKSGYTPISVPAYARQEAFYQHGQFPTSRDQVYQVDGDDMFLAGTSEVLLNALHANEILPEAELSKSYAGVSTCFRSEAGSAGKDTRGLMRVHQFNKVEQYVFCPADLEISNEWFEKMLGISQSILKALELPYRTLEVATGDMGLGKFRQVDIESWVPSEERYRETHSCSALLDWQARRANLRYKGADGKVKFGFTLNNTALATPRVLVMLLENHQNQDGTVNVPIALQPFFGKAKLESNK